MAGVVDGLFCMLATLGVVPLIRCPRGGAAEHVAAQVREGASSGAAAAGRSCCCWATAAGCAAVHNLCRPSRHNLCCLCAAPCVQLDARLRDALAGRSSLFSEGGAGAGLAASLQRPLLCLFDRNFELSVVLQHAWTYKPLVGATGRCPARGKPGSKLQPAEAWPRRLGTPRCCGGTGVAPHAAANPARPFASLATCLPPSPPPGARRAGYAAEPHHGAGCQPRAGATGRR